MSLFEIRWEIKNLETRETSPENDFHEAGSRGHIEQRFYELVQPWEAYKNNKKKNKKWEFKLKNGRKNLGNKKKIKNKILLI